MSESTYSTMLPVDGEEERIEESLRPRSLEEYIGQAQLKENLRVFIDAAKKRGEPLSHILFCGPPGLGKTTLAHIIARELNVDIYVTSGPALEKPGDLAGILTNLREGDILFIDEIHRLHRAVEEYLYPAMEDFRIDIVTGKGLGSSTLRINLERFTLVGATTRLGLLTHPLRNRFGFIAHLDFYSIEELERVIEKAAKLLKVEITSEGAHEIAIRSRGTPRVSIRLLRMVRDFAQVQDAPITSELAVSALEKLGVDALGLEKLDREFLRVVVEKFEGGPVGLKTIASSLHEDEDTIENVIEPYLMRIGFIKKTARGRVATQKAFNYLGVKRKVQEERLFNE